MNRDAPCDAPWNSWPGAASRPPSLAKASAACRRAALGHVATPPGHSRGGIPSDGGERIDRRCARCLCPEGVTPRRHRLGQSRSVRSLRGRITDAGIQPASNGSDRHCGRAESKRSRSVAEPRRRRPASSRLLQKTTIKDHGYRDVIESESEAREVTRSDRGRHRVVRGSGGMLREVPVRLVC